MHGASKVATSFTEHRLLDFAGDSKQVIALLDPDVAGRQSRTLVDKLLPGRVLHAFIPGLHATAGQDIRYSLASACTLHVCAEHQTLECIVLRPVQAGIMACFLFWFSQLFTSRDLVRVCAGPRRQETLALSMHHPTKSGQLQESCPSAFGYCTICA